MRADRWTTGGELMRAANPQGWDRLVADSQLASDNRKAIDACRTALARTGKGSALRGDPGASPNLEMTEAFTTALLLTLSQRQPTSGLVRNSENNGQPQNRPVCGGERLEKSDREQKLAGVGLKR
jgi:Family of unknown function (DUF6118)